MLAFFHTLASNVDKFEDLARKYAPEEEIRHFVNEEILSFALRHGTRDDSTFDAEIEKIRTLQPQKIICTCSTYGEASDRHPDVWRIDRPVVEYIVKNYTQIGLAYAAESTYDMSLGLISAAAKVQHRMLSVKGIDCTEAWSFFEKNDMEAYSKLIAQKIQAYAQEVEVVFLAQASMEGAKAYLSDFEREVYASPEFGVKQILTSL